MDILPVDDDEQYVSHVYRIVLGWIILTILIGILASVATL